MKEAAGMRLQSWPGPEHEGPEILSLGLGRRCCKLGERQGHLCTGKRCWTGRDGAERQGSLGEEKWWADARPWPRGREEDTGVSAPEGLDLEEPGE